MSTPISTLNAFRTFGDAYDDILLCRPPSLSCELAKSLLRTTRAKDYLFHLETTITPKRLLAATKHSLSDSPIVILHLVLASIHHVGNIPSLDVVA